jgi:hypothetical protein
MSALNVRLSTGLSSNQLRKQSKFDLPGPSTDSHGNVTGDNDIPIAVIDDPNKAVSSTSFRLPAAYQALEKVGFKITSYDER